MSVDLYRELITDCRILSTEWVHLNHWSDPDYGKPPRFVAITYNGSTTNGHTVNASGFPHAFVYLWQAQAAAKEYALRYHKPQPTVITWAAYVAARRRILIGLLRMVRDSIKAITIQKSGDPCLDQFRHIIKGKLRRPRITA